MRFAEVIRGDHAGDWGEITGRAGPVVFLRVLLSPHGHKNRTIIVPRRDLR